MMAKVLHCPLMLFKTPALHELQLKHSTFWSLLHFLQSMSWCAGPFLGTVQNVALWNLNPQYTGGLQHPDCIFIHMYKQKVFNAIYTIEVTIMHIQLSFL